MLLVVVRIVDVVVVVYGSSALLLTTCRNKIQDATSADTPDAAVRVLVPCQYFNVFNRYKDIVSSSNPFFREKLSPCNGVDRCQESSPLQ